MKCFFAIIICITQCLSLRAMDRPIVNRYSPKTEWLMGILSSSNSLRNFARSQRVISQIAPNRWIQLFMDAQRSVGVPAQDMLPVRLGTHDEKNSDAIALADMSEIVIMPHNFDNRHYGAQRITALHEASHHKYHDASLAPWMFLQVMKANFVSTGLTTLAGWGIIYAKWSSSLRYLGYAAVPFMSYAANAAIFLGLARYIGLLDAFPSKIDDYVEFRADRNAVEVAQCAQCVKEYAEYAASGNTHYLTKEDLAQYKAYYERKNLYCNHHKAERSK